MVMGLVALLLSLTAHAQGGNTGIGEAYDAHESLSRRLLHLEKKNDAFNLYVNFAGALQAGSIRNPATRPGRRTDVTCN